MRIRVRVLLAVVLVLAALPGATRIVHKEQSLYRTILVTEEGSRVCLQFSVRREQKNQSCINRNNPKRMVFTYTRMIMAALLLQPSPDRILVVGLGGGTLPTALRELLPEADIDIVEIDPAVIRVAEVFFNFTATESMRVFTQDARVFTKRAAQRGDTYDLILLDAYNGDYIPEHLMTKEYLEETKSLLTPGGVVAANTFAKSRLYAHESETYLQVFGRLYNFKLPSSSNRIVLASNGPLPGRESLDAQAKFWKGKLKAYSIPISGYPALMSSEVDWDRSTRPLTDQYSPANLLQAQP
ncbi:MAG: fused MFS/spermidine synthase [Gammaproteobacteria bacterium]|nr:fused MFS/spermidine synthase [Gammaproteobacteria bacterium]